MNIFFLIPFLAVATFGIYQDSFAENIETGYNYFKTYNPDGTITMTTHEPYVFDGNNWVPYVSSGTQVQTHMGTVTLNSDGIFTWNGKFDDSIRAKYADISDLNTWTYLNSLNNDVPDISWNGSELTSEKQNSVGNLKYKYILDNGKWKTQLEATNLSSLTTKVFGFDQIINLNSDMIKFGGVTRNLDNFDGQTFSKAFLDANQGKVLDLLNGIQHDFDLGYENLYSITVHDTGANKSQLVFDYRTSEILLPGQTLIIDPTYSVATASDGRLFSTATTSVNCSATYGSTDGDYKLNLGASGGSNTCQVAYAVWDLSTIPSGSTMISGTIEYDVTAELNPVDCQFVISSTNTVGQQMYDDGRFAGLGVNATSKSSTCVGVADGKVENFLSSSFSTFESKFGSTMTLLTTSMTKGVTNARDALDRNSDFRDNDAELTIVYTVADPPDAITDLGLFIAATETTIGLNWTAPFAGGGGQTIIGYQLNVTTPQTNEPLVFINDTGTTTTNYNVTGLLFGTDYSARVSAWTNVTSGHPLNNATGNVYNFTTTSNTYALPPVLTAFGPSSAITQINLEFPGSTMQNINGYRIQRETPIGTGWVTIVSNTTSATQYYNNTGLTENIIYNYRVYAMNNTGISTVSNTYAMTTFHLPDAVTDLTGTPTDLSTINLSWSAPESYAPVIQGYMINGTTPTGEPVDILNANTESTATTATALNLQIGQEYSFRVSPITVHGKNASGNIWNGSTIQTFVIGNLSNPDITNDDDFSIFFDRTDVNASAIQLDVTYPNSYDVSCDFSYKYARTNHTYSGLSTVPDGADDQVATFTLINATGDLVQVRCWDVLTGDESIYVITITDFPFLQQVNALRNGEYGTFFQIGAFDGVMLIVIFLGMIGLNRTTPIVGIIFVVITTFVMSYFQLITYPVIMYPALIMMIVWAFVTTRKDD